MLCLGCISGCAHSPHQEPVLGRSEASATPGPVASKKSVRKPARTAKASEGEPSSKAASAVEKEPAVPTSIKHPLRVFGGRASYYADKLAGRATASGEPYDIHRFTAAHRTLPLGTLLRVVCPDTQSSVVVVVNDRGPFAKGRVIDLSRAAAEKLGMLRRGVARVRVEVLELGPKHRGQKKKR